MILGAKRHQFNSKGMGAGGIGLPKLFGSLLSGRIFLRMAVFQGQFYKSPPDNAKSPRTDIHKTLHKAYLGRHCALHTM